MSPPVATLAPRKPSILEQLQRANTMLFLTKRLLFVLLLFALDIRDIVYKVAWIGPTDSYSFRTGSTSVLHPDPLVSTVTSQNRALDAGEHVQSGWSSFLSQCDELRAFGAAGSSFFLSALGTNCSVRVGGNATRVIPQLVMTSSIRADVPIWASCLFLHIARRPPLCQDHITTHFNDRYAFTASKIFNVDVVPPESDAEAEILRFLALMSVSIPLHRVVCVEAFELADGATGTFAASIYGCASPNEFRSAFVGLAAPQYQRLLWGKAWLTNDEISILGQRFGIRQNVKSHYAVAQSTQHSGDSGVLSITSISQVNFSSYGPLYALMVALDLWLLLTHCYSVFEILKWMLFPQYRELQLWSRALETSCESPMVVPDRLQHSRADVTMAVPPHERPSGAALVFQEERFYAFFSASYYKTPTYLGLSRLTRVLSWVIILPNSVVWTWSESANEKVQAYLSSVKSWVLIAAAVQLLWRGLVRASEARAYAFVRGTFITHVELIVIGALAAVLLRDNIFLMCEKKWSVENQRVNDSTSFHGGYVAHANTFERENDYRTSTPFEILVILYDPLVRIILLSLAMIATWLLVKYAFFAALARAGATCRRSSTIDVSSSDPSALASNDESSAVNQPGGASPRSGNHHDSSNTSHHHSASACESYARLPLEDALDIPIRAKSLVRYGLNMEVVRDGKRYIRPSCYLDYGIMLKYGAAKAHVSVTEIFRKHHNRRRLSSMMDRATSIIDTATPRSPAVDSMFQQLLRSTPVATQMLFEASTLTGQDALLAVAAARNESLATVLQETDGIVRSSYIRAPSSAPLRGPRCTALRGSMDQSSHNE